MDGAHVNLIAVILGFAGFFVVSAQSQVVDVDAFADIHALRIRITIEYKRIEITNAIRLIDTVKMRQPDNKNNKNKSSRVFCMK